MTEYQIKQQICEIGRRVYAKGFAAANDGNISIRLDDKRVLCSPTIVSKGFLKCEDLCIVDLEEEDGSFHGHDFDGPHGFGHTALASSLHQAGFTGVEFQPCHRVIRDGVTYPLFLATCTRHTS